ncbi:MAG: MMPL family transporter [Kofleriaceae bacterium]|nr:MMPL family transporter [Kofleriaceae bacterium]
MSSPRASSAPPPVAAQRYVAWLVRRGLVVIAAAAVLFGVAVYLTAFHLPLKADFSHLLPQDAPSVRDLRKLDERVTTQDTLLILVTADDPEIRARVAAQIAEAARALPPTLVSRVETDDAATRAFLRAHRHLFVPLDDLIAARDALRTRIDQAKLEANPLYVNLDEDETDADAAAARQRLDELRQRRHDAEARLDHSGYVGPDGHVQLLVVRTGFAKTDVAQGKALMAALQRARAEVLARPGNAGARIGLTAGVPGTIAEHDALVRGMLLSSLITVVLVALALWLYLRSIILLGLLSGSLVVGTTVSFGVAAVTVGHLNAATAFLGAIIAGNGVNYGILLLARYLEERRRHSPEDAMARAIHGTLRPTIVASLGASIAYGSLAATSFRGFADFAIIGGVGMILCWLASYSLLPAMVLRWGTRTRIVTSDPVLGGWLARLFGFRRAGVVCAVALVVFGATAWESYRYVADDPFEYDITKLRSNGDDAIEVRRWMALSDANFGRGISGQTFIAVDRLDQVPEVVAALRKVDDGVAPERRTIGVIHSILDVVPEDQPAKLAVLAEIRALLDDDALDALGDDERAEIAELRPPDDLQPITPEGLPEELKVRLRERDGRIGYLIGVRPDTHLDEWNGKDLIRFATAIRRIELADGETLTTSGTQVIYADILGTISKDGPTVVAVASLCLIVMVLLVVGRNLRAVAVLVATSMGSLGLIAVCSVTGIKVTFLDFVALPITLGLGVDYAINIAHRHHQDEEVSAAETLRTSGAAVFLCSLTTIIGYGSLLVSDNLAIRGFGTASLIGEICCLATALIVVPAIVGLKRSRAGDGGVTSEVALGEQPPVAR